MTSDAMKQETGALEALISGYEERVNTVTRYMTRAADFLGQLHKAQDAMVEKLRETLAERRSLRRKDFDVMVEPILVKRRERQDSLPATIEAFRQEETLLVGELRRMLTASTTDALGEWPGLKKKMLSLERM